MALTVVVEDIDPATSAVLFLCPAVEVVAEIVVLGRPNLTLLTASAIIVVTEAAISEVRTRLVTIEVLETTEPAISEVLTRLAAKLVLELTEADAVASLTRTASTAVVMAIDALAEASTILASKAASGADARGLKPSIC